DIPLEVFGGVAALETGSVTDAYFIRICSEDCETGIFYFISDSKDVLGDIYQTTGQIAGVGGLKRGVNHTLAGAAGSGKVFQRSQALFIATLDRKLDGLSGSISGNTQHTDGFHHLADVTAGTGYSSDCHAGISINKLAV